MRAPSVRVLKHTASHREKRISTAHKTYDPNAWRYDEETGLPKPPVGEAELRRAHVVSLSNNDSLQRLPRVVGPAGPSQLGPYGAAAAISSPIQSVGSTPKSSLRTQGSGDARLVSPRSALGGPSTLSSEPAVGIESRDVSAPEDLQTVRELRAEVMRLQNGLPSHHQTSLEDENARLERECEGLRRRVEGYQLTMEQFGRRMAEMEAENVTLKVQVDIMHKQQAARGVATASGADELDPSATLLDELSELLRSERRKSRISRGDLPPQPDGGDRARESAPARPASKSDLLETVRRANAALEAELREGKPEAGRPERRASVTTSTGSAEEARGGHPSCEVQRKKDDSASKDSVGPLAGGSELGAESKPAETPAEARLAAADRAERRLRELEAELKQTKVEEMADKMRQIEGKFNQALGKVDKPVQPFDALSLDAQLAELGLCGGEYSPEPRSPEPRVD